MEQVSRILNISLSPNGGTPATVTVNIIAQVTSSGWTNPTLVPYTLNPPAKDGISRFRMEADPPSEPVTQTATQLRMTYQWENLPANVLGIQIHGSESNATALYP